MRTVPQKAVDLVKHFEGLKLKAYRCPAGVLTIGYGHTGPFVTEGKEITEAIAEQLLTLDLASFADIVEKKFPGLSDGQFGALISLTFNVGPSPLDKTLGSKLRSGDTVGAANEFLRWNKSRGAVLPGLVKRRAAERELFLGA